MPPTRSRPPRFPWVGDEPRKPSNLDRTGRDIVLWLTFFLICLGLGYPTLSRYDPRKTGGLFDTQEYYELVNPVPGADYSHMRFRLLIPLMARPIDGIAAGHIGTWDPVFLALLTVNAFFTATTAYLLVFDRPPASPRGSSRAARGVPVPSQFRDRESAAIRSDRFCRGLLPARHRLESAHPAPLAIALLGYAGCTREGVLRALRDFLHCGLVDRRASP